MTKVNEIYGGGGDWLKVATAEEQGLFGKELTISAEKVVEIRDKKKIELSFEGIDAKLLLNSTNAKILAEDINEDSANWVGKRLVLVKSKTTFQGAIVDSIQVNPLGDTADQ